MTTLRKMENVSSLGRPSTPRAAAAGEAWRTLPLEGAFQFTYRDAAGAASFRQLIAHELKVGPGKTLLGGTDLGLGAYRGFRADRIHVLEDVGTGETVDRDVIDWLLKRAEIQARRRRRVDAAAARAGVRMSEPVAAPASAHSG